MGKIIKRIGLPLAVLVLLFAFGFALQAAQELKERLSGRILLQVESHGEAWYVDPVSKTRVSLGRPSDAFSVMREFGLGVTNADLAKIATNTATSTLDNATSRRLAGRILLQTESHGEAWYVSPVNLRRYFLGSPADALQIMRSLGLGITNSNLAQIPIFSSSNLQDRVAGRILLQTESHGEAWYVDPVSKKRVSLGTPAEALNLMRRLGLGISNSNLDKIALPDQAAKNTSFTKRIAGRILLQVESHGEAWYVDPVSLKRYGLGRPADALQVMRDLGLGITNKDLEKIPVLNF